MTRARVMGEFPVREDGNQCYGRAYVIVQPRAGGSVGVAVLETQEPAVARVTAKNGTRNDGHKYTKLTE